MEVQVIVFPNRNIYVNNLVKNVPTLELDVGSSRISDFRKKSVVGQKALNAEVVRIQKMLDRALAKETKNPDQAVQLYGSAWFASEMLLKVSAALRPL